jgi:hypothetical protein
MVIREYNHLKLDEDIQCIAGHYKVIKEVRAKYLNREFFYVVVQMVVDSSCCGGGRWQHAHVYGYIINWQKHTGSEGLPITEVEPITGPVERESIKQIIQKTEFVSQVEFR